MQPTHAAEAETWWRVPEGVPRRASVQRDRDRSARVLRSLWQGHGSGYHVRPGEEEV